MPKSVTPEIDIDLANAIEAATAAVEGRRPNLIDSQTTKTVTEPTTAELIEIANAAVEGRKPNLPLNKEDLSSIGADNTQEYNNSKSLTDKDFKPTKKSSLVVSPKQFGKKIGKHAIDYGLDPALDSSRERMNEIIHNIFCEATEVRVGPWRGQVDDVLFYIKDEDVVVTSQEGEFITVLKGGIHNARVKNARKRKIQ